MAEFTNLRAAQPHMLQISILYQRDMQSNKDNIQLNKVTDSLEKDVG